MVTDERVVAILDANVLFPFRKRDVLLSFHSAGLFHARWSKLILQEWTGRLLVLKPGLAMSIESQMAAMAQHFQECWVEGVERRISTLSLPDPNDRHVLAAAIKCGARYIVTDNLRDFPASALAAHGIDAVDADVFLSMVFDRYRDSAISVLEDVRARYRNPSYTPSEFIADLAAKGLPRLASRLPHLR
jgi:predicted nucleic acid-binding protein